MSDIFGITRSWRRSLRVAGWLVVLLASTAPLLADNAKKEATKQLKKVAASVLKDFKLVTNAHRGDLAAELDLLDAKLKLGTATITQVADIAAALNEFQDGVRTALDQAETDFANGKAAQLAELSSVGITAVADWPAGFLSGGGSIVDQHRAAILRAIDDLYAAVTTRVRKTADLFEKELGIAVTFRVRAPDDYEQRTTGGVITADPLTIDVIVAASSTTATNDGRVYLYGFGNPGDGSMSIASTTKFSSSSSITTVTASVSGRWTFSHFSLTEGDRMYSIYHPGNTGGTARTSITVP